MRCGVVRTIHRAAAPYRFTSRGLRVAPVAVASVPRVSSLDFVFFWALVLVLERTHEARYVRPFEANRAEAWQRLYLGRCCPSTRARAPGPGRGPSPGRTRSSTVETTTERRVVGILGNVVRALQ